MESGNDLLVANDTRSSFFVGATPVFNIGFHNAAGEVGRLDWSDGTMRFTGNADESAKAFFDAFAHLFKQHCG